MTTARESSGDKPRVLFVTPAAFNEITGGGITFSNLFRGWPVERLATVHSDPVQVSHDVCRQFYRLAPVELGRWPAFMAPQTDGLAASPAALPASVTPLHHLKSTIVGNTWPDRGWLSPALEAWIDAFRPQIIYTILGTIGMLELVERIRSRFQLRLVVHFMDDWPSTLYRGGFFSPVLQRLMERRLRNLVGVAAGRLGICDDMCAAYERRYGVPFLSIQNPISDVSAHTAWAGRTSGSPARLLYVGSIFDNAQLQSLIDIAQAVVRLNLAGRRIVFEIYSPVHLSERFRSQLEIHPAITLHDTIADHDRFFETIAAADAVVLPVNFDAASVRFIRYSMPTKIPAYLASGAPILVYGPRETAQVAYAGRSGWGVVVDQRSETVLDAGLTDVLFNDDVRERVAAAARATARRDHDTTVVRTRFQAALASAAEGQV